MKDVILWSCVVVFFGAHIYLAGVDCGKRLERDDLLTWATELYEDVHGVEVCR